MGTIDQSKELDFGGLYVAFLRVEDQSILPGYPYQLMEIQIVFLGVFAMDEDIIHNANGAQALTQDIIHGLLKGILGHLQAKKESDESVPANWAVESCQFR